MPFVKRIKFQCNNWYMDDGTMGDNIDTLLTDFKMLLDEGRKLRLIVKIAKCEVIAENLELVREFRVVAPDIIHSVNNEAAGCTHQ